MNPEYKGAGRLPKDTIRRICVAVKCAITVHSNMFKSGKVTREQAAKEMRISLLNIAWHIYGFHNNCGKFCKVKHVSVQNINDGIHKIIYKMKLQKG